MAASSGYNVIGVESSEVALETGRNRIEASLSKLLGSAVKKGKMTQAAADQSKASTLGHLDFSVDKKALVDCDIIVEAIVEDLNVKIPFYKNLGQLVKPEAIFASNTSSLAITKMALASGRADRFGKV